MSTWRRKGWSLVSLVAIASLGSAAASAATVSCPGTTTTTDREFILTTSDATGAVCLVNNNGNSLNGVSDPLNAMGYVTLDSTADATTGLLNGALSIVPLPGVSGTFTINPTLVAGFTNFVIGFQAGTAGINPDYAAFLLPAGILGGSWSIASTDADLGNVNRVILYAQPVPLPAAAWLLLSGLVGFGLVARRRPAA